MQSRRLVVLSRSHLRPRCHSGTELISSTKKKRGWSAVSGNSVAAVWNRLMTSR
jgi:hypothetical protein